MIYTAGQNLLSRADLANIEVPVRTNVGKHWEGLQHGVLADTLVAQLEARGLEITKETWYTNPLGDTLWGAVDILPENASPSLEIGQAAAFSLGVRHSNTGRYAVSFAVGARITVCSNGLFAGDFVLKRNHTKGIQLQGVIDEGIDRYLGECEALESLINNWREVELDDKDAAFILFEAHRNNAISFRHLETVHGHWVKPPHEEFAPRTAWSLYNAFTETAKELVPPAQMRMLTGLRKTYNEVLVGV